MSYVMTFTCLFMGRIIFKWIAVESGLLKKNGSALPCGPASNSLSHGCTYYDFLCIIDWPWLGSLELVKYLVKLPKLGKTPKSQVPGTRSENATPKKKVVWAQFFVPAKPFKIWHILRKSINFEFYLMNALIYVDIDYGIHNVKVKVVRNEK